MGRCAVHCFSCGAIVGFGSIEQDYCDGDICYSYEHQKEAEPVVSGDVPSLPDGFIWHEPRVISTTPCV